MAKHPIQEAFGLGESPTNTGAAADIADAVETYAPFVVFSVDGITTKNLERTKHVVLITGSSIRFYKYDATNTDPEDGETVILDSEDRAFVLVQRGDRYDLPFSYTGGFATAETLNPIAIVTALTLLAGLPGSVALCLTPPASSAVFTFEKSADHGATWSSVFTVTFSSGSRVGSFTLASDATLAAGDMIRPKAPSPADGSLAGFIATIACAR